MKSAEVKAKMLGQIMYGSHYSACVTEYGGYGVTGVADLFGIRDNGYSHEFEVKVSRQDLMGELNSIQAVLNEGNIFEKTTISKASKHKHYINGSPTNPYMIFDTRRPNQFSFAVIKELEELAVEKLKGTPYGLYVVVDDTKLTQRVDPRCVIKAKYLHKDKVDQKVYLNILRKACTEVEFTRAQLARGLRCTGCYSHLPTVCEMCTATRKREAEMRKEWAKNNQTR